MTGSKYGSININNNKEPKKGEYTDREVPSRLQEDDEDQGRHAVIFDDAELN